MDNFVWCSSCQVGSQLRRKFLESGNSESLSPWQNERHEASLEGGGRVRSCCLGANGAYAGAWKSESGTWKLHLLAMLGSLPRNQTPNMGDFQFPASSFRRYPLTSKSVLPPPSSTYPPPLSLEAGSRKLENGKWIMTAFQLPATLSDQRRKLETGNSYPQT